MSIKLKKAAQQALDAFDAFGDDDDFASLFALTQKMNALRTAIQQAESEPVLFVSPEQARAVTGKNRVHYTPSDNSGRYLPVRATPAGLFVQPLYTHPAPGVPDTHAKAMEALLDFAQTVGGSSSFWDDVWPEHEAAMLAAKGK